MLEASIRNLATTGQNVATMCANLPGDTAIRSERVIVDVAPHRHHPVGL